MIYVLYGRDRDDEQWSALTWSPRSAEEALALLVEFQRCDPAVLRASPPPLTMTRVYATNNPDNVPELLPAEAR